MNNHALSTIHLRDGRTVTLAHATEADAAAFLTFAENISGESDFVSFGPGEFAITLEQEIAFLKGLADGSKGLMLKAVVDGEMVGNAVLNRFTRPRIRHVAHLGLSVRKAFWSSGIGTALCQTAFAEAKRLGVTRISLHVRADHSRAIRLYEHLGFTHQGRLVGVFRIGDQEFDELVMGLRI